MSGGSSGQQQYGQPSQGRYFQDLQQSKGGMRTAESDGGLYPPMVEPPGTGGGGGGTPPPGGGGSSGGSGGGYGSPNPYSGGYGGPIQPSGPAYGSGGGIPIQRAGNWYSVPHLQTYGGQAAPFSDLSAQILNAMQMTQQGAGRFNSNAAARYGFQGGVQQFRPDANPWGQPIMPYQWQPQWNPPRANPPPSSGPPGAPLPGSPPPGTGTPPPGTGTPPPGTGTPPPGGGSVDHNANFRRLLQTDPRLAYAYQSHGNGPSWYSDLGNRANLQRDLFGGDQNRYLQFQRENSPISSNAAPLSPREMRLLNQMQGINNPSFDSIFGSASAEDTAWINQMLGR